MLRKMLLDLKMEFCGYMQNVSEKNRKDIYHTLIHFKSCKNFQKLFISFIRVLV